MSKLTPVTAELTAASMPLATVVAKVVGSFSMGK
jgi:hypothetical protein